MNAPPKRSLHDSPPNLAEVFLSVRDFLNEHPMEQDLCAEALASRVGAPVVEVEAAFEALVVEGEVLP